MLLPAVSQAQPGSLTVVTNPPGAEVELEGEAGLSGVTPVTFNYLLIGEYKLTIRKHGFETYETRLVLDPIQPQQINVDLSPKTTTKAVLRSLVIPGWGQSYSGQKTKSLFFKAMFVGAALNLYLADDDFRSRRDEYLQRLDEYDAALAGSGSVDDLERRHAVLIAAQREAYDAESDRRLAAAITVGVWGLNLIDAVLFTPGERSTFSVKGLTIVPSAGTAGAGVAVTMAF